MSDFPSSQASLQRAGRSASLNDLLHLVSTACERYKRDAGKPLPRKPSVGFSNLVWVKMGKQNDHKQHVSFYFECAIETPPCNLSK